MAGKLHTTNSAPPRAARSPPYFSVIATSSGSNGTISVQVGNRARIAGCWVHFILGSLARDEGWLAVAPWADADLVGQAEGDVAAAVPGGEGGDINEVVTNGGAAGFATALASGPRGIIRFRGSLSDPKFEWIALNRWYGCMPATMRH